jgi:hypothetical protein
MYVFIFISLPHFLILTKSFYIILFQKLHFFVFKILLHFVDTKKSTRSTNELSENRMKNLPTNVNLSSMNLISVYLSNMQIELYFFVQEADLCK